MGMREAACSCGQLTLEVTGDPVAVSICHCLACQRRTGSAFGMQARFAPAQVEISGRYTDYARTSDEADRKVHVFHFCPDCGSTVFSTEPDEPDRLVVMVGAFADPSFPPPAFSGYHPRRHRWLELPESMGNDDIWAPFRPLYEAGEYAEAADRAAGVLDAHPDHHPMLAYNIACCESLAGRTADALRHLRIAVERSQELRELAARDSDLDPIRDDPAFRELIG
jgi:hypothetical protein